MKILLAGLTEIAEMAGVTTQLASNWSTRSPTFPKPIAELRSGKIWDRRQVLAWLQANHLARDMAPIKAEELFTEGVTYSLSDIRAQLGGETMSYLPQHGSQIVCGRFDRSMNPRAPREVLVGNLTKVVRKARLLIAQGGSIPVFIKEKTDTWSFQGLMKAVRFDTSSARIASAAASAGRKDPIAGILDFVRIGETAPEFTESDLFPSSLAVTNPPTPASGDRMPAIPTYEKSRLWFIRDVIEPLQDQQQFAVRVTGVGLFVMSKADFYLEFPNVVTSKSYLDNGHYHYPTLPERAHKYMRS